MNTEQVLWKGEHVRLVKEPGGKYWAGIGNQGYAPVRFKCLGPAADAYAIYGFASTDVKMFEVEGRQNMEELLDWAKACDTLYPQWSAEKKAARQKHEDKEQARRAAEYAERDRRQCVRDAAEDLLAACESMVKTLVTCSNRPGQEAEGNAAFAAARVAIAKAKGFTHAVGCNRKPCDCNMDRPIGGRS